jgi:hypothetical protein
MLTDRQREGPALVPFLPACLRNLPEDVPSLSCSILLGALWRLPSGEDVALDDEIAAFLNKESA